MAASPAPIAQASGEDPADGDALGHRRFLVEGGRPHGDARSGCGRTRRDRSMASTATTMVTTWVWEIAKHPDLDDARPPTGSPSPRS